MPDQAVSTSPRILLVRVCVQASIKPDDPRNTRRFTTLVPFLTRHSCRFSTCFLRTVHNQGWTLPRLALDVPRRLITLAASRCPYTLPSALPPSRCSSALPLLLLRRIPTPPHAPPHPRCVPPAMHWRPGLLRLVASMVCCGRAWGGQGVRAVIRPAARTLGDASTSHLGLRQQVVHIEECGTGELSRALELNGFSTSYHPPAAAHILIARQHGELWCR